MSSWSGLIFATEGVDCSGIQKGYSKCLVLLFFG